MSERRYFVTGPSLDGQFGIAVVDVSARQNAVTMHFLRSQVDAERLAERLNRDQKPIEGFCAEFLAGCILENL